MEQSNSSTEVPESRVAAPELVRPREGRMVAGVAQGLANRFAVPVMLIRIVFALLVFGGGLGLALYAAGWFLIRGEDEAEAPAERFFSGASTTRSWVGIVLVFVAAMILLDNFTFLSSRAIWAVGLLVVGILLYTGDLPRLLDRSGEGNEEEPAAKSAAASAATTATADSAEVGPAARGMESTHPAPTPPILPVKAAPRKAGGPKEQSYLGRITIGVMLVGLGVLAILDNVPGLPLEPEPRHYMALAVTILGLGLVVGGFIGRARWLILVGVIMVPTMLFSPVFEYDWSAENFDRTINPETFAEVEGFYSIDVGSLVVDLRELPWDGQTIALDVSANAGNIQVFIPEGVAVVGEASVDAGQVVALGKATGGFGRHALTFDESGDLGMVELIVSTDVGNINIVRD